LLLLLLLLQAINGGNATWFGIPIPFDLNTLLAIVSGGCTGAAG